MKKNAVIAALVAALALSIAAGVMAQAQRTAEVQLRLWEHADDPTRNELSIRPEGGRWYRDTRPLPFDDGFSADGRYRYEDLTIETAVPDTVPLGLEIGGLSCFRGQLNPFLSLHGWVRNVTDATIRDITVTAALRDRSGVEVSQGAAILLHGISPWGKRPFVISFYQAVGTKGTCHVVGVTYDASIRFDEPTGRLADE